MDETTTDQPDRPEWRVELPHFPFADEHERRRHDLRERVAYFRLDVREDPNLLQLQDLGREAHLPVEVLEELLHLLDHHGQGRCTGPVALQKAETEAWHRGYDTGYTASREDAADGFDARGDEEE